MAVSSNLNSNEKKEYAARPHGTKKRKKKKDKADPSARKATASKPKKTKTYEEVTNNSFLMDPTDWLEASDDLSFDDIQAAVSKAMHAEYDTEYKSGTGYSGGEYAGNGKVCRYYIYKVWPDKVVFKRAYGNTNEEDPLFVMHDYEMDGEGKALLGPVVPVDMGFVPAGTGMSSFLTAVRESDEISIDDPQLAEDLSEAGEEDEPDEEDLESAAEDAEEGESEDEDADSEEEDGGEEDVQEASLREDIANVKEQELKEEYFERAIDDSCRLIEGKNGSFVLENMAVIGLKSKNGREYPTDTRKRALPLFEGAKAYANHPKKGEEDNARGVAEAIGIHRNVYYDPKTDLVRSNLHLSPTDFVKGYIVPHAKTNPSIIGNSINGGGKLTESGKVLEITKIHSIDLVTDPATTNGLFESVDKTKPEGENTMALTLKEVLENKDLAEEVRKHFREEFDVENSVEDLQSENERLREELAERKVKDQAEENRKAVTKLIAESKLPKASKEDKELFKILEEAKPEHRVALITRFEKVVESTEADLEEEEDDDKPAPSGVREKKMKENVDKKTLAKALMEGLTGGHRR